VKSLFYPRIVGWFAVTALVVSVIAMVTAAVAVLCWG
jgi:hypothetical protein